MNFTIVRQREWGLMDVEGKLTEIHDEQVRTRQFQQETTDELREVKEFLYGTNRAQRRDGISYRMNRVEDMVRAAARITWIAVGAAIVSVIGAIKSWIG